MSRSRASRDDRQPPSRKPSVIVPHSALSEPVQRLMVPHLSIVTTGGKKLGEMLKCKKRDEKNNNSVVYRIPCGKCHRVYYGETGRGMETRIREHKADLRHHRSSNAFVAHVDEEGHLPNWLGAVSLTRSLAKSQRKVVEAAFIAKGNTINTSADFFRLASVAATIITDEYDSFS